MGGAKLDSLYIRPEDQNKQGKKNLEIKVTRGNDESVEIFEQIDKIKIDENTKGDNLSVKELEVQYCMRDPFSGVQECAKIFDIDDSGYAKQLDNYALTLGKSCKSLKFRPGSVLNGYSSWLDDFYYDGNLCKLEYRGPPITNDNYLDCCTEKIDKNKCNLRIRNEFDTDHCNSGMVDYCKDNPASPVCIKWLNNRTRHNDDTALILYSDLCKKNHDSIYCTYMCLIARKYDNYFSKYCDNALIEWCKNNESNKCNCIQSNQIIVKEFEKYIGPKYCWLDQCVNTQQKWKTTEMINGQEKCNILTCVIEINKLLTIGNSKIELINNCLSGGLSSRDAFSRFIEFSDLKKEQTYGCMFYPVLTFIFISLTLFIIFYFYDYRDRELDVKSFKRKY